MISLLLLALVTSAEPPRRAVIVGSNTPIQGRVGLRYAHDDANAMAEVLRANGGFKAEDVTVLLDAKPAAVLAALDAAREVLAKAPEHGLLLFYYSGHADQSALYPAGEALLLSDLKARLSDEALGVRIGIIDACRGGGWTQAKGLTPTKPFEIGVPALSSEGTALLAASSGLEDAHEAEGLQGSFFTHYLVAGLRGAADATGDGQVTLSEAFAYANRLTIRDTATRSKQPQHPSFDLRLRGRQDVVLTSLESNATQLVVSQTEGPLEVVQLSTGITVAEAAPGEQLLRLALPPGPYLVRRLKGTWVYSREVAVKANEATQVEETQLTLVGQQALGRKGPENGLLGGAHEISLAFGTAPFDAFVAGFTLSLDYTVFFNRFIGGRVLSATYIASFDKGLKAQLERDFGVLPTAFQAPEATAHTAFVIEPTLIESDGTLLRTGVFAGGGAMLSRRFTSETATGLRTLSPAGVLGVELNFMFLRMKEVGGLGLRLALTDTLELAVNGPHNVLWFSLAMAFDLGHQR
jgi:uncharacterized caspase-like protein